MRIQIVFLFLLISRVQPLFAEKLTLDEVLSSLKKSFPVLLAAQEELPGARGELYSAEGSFDPTLNFDAAGNTSGFYGGKRYSATYNQPLKDLYGSRLFSSYGISRGDYPIYDGKLVTNDGGEIRAGIEIPILRDSSIDKRRAQIDKSRIGIEVAEANIRQREVDVTRAATIAYFEWVAAGARKRIFDSLLRTAIARTAQIKSRVKSGDLPSFDLTDNQRAELQRKSQLVIAERAFRQASYDLSLFRRDQNNQPSIPDEKILPKQIQEPQLEDYVGQLTVDEAMKARPELKRIAAQKNQNEIEVRLQKNQLMPKLDVQVGASNDLGAGPESIGETETFLGLRVEVPLMVRAARGKLQSTEAKIRELSSLEQFQKERISNEVKDALVALEMSRERVQIAKEEKNAAEELAIGEATRFNLGDSNLIFVNLREQTAAESAIREVDALLDYQKALAAFKAANGKAFLEK